MKELQFKIGDSVIAKGNYYQSANGTLLGGKVVKKKGLIKRVAPKGSHPYEIDTLVGWFNEDSISEYKIPEVEVGDKVQLIKNQNYLRKPMPYSIGVIYDLKSIDDDLAIIEFKDIEFKVNVYNLKKA